MTNQTTETRSMIAVANDIYADKTGRCTISIRGMANLMDVSKTAVQKRLDVKGGIPTATSNVFDTRQKVAQSDFQGATSNAI